MLVSIIVIILSLVVSAIADAQPSGHESYLAQLIDQAQEKRLAEQREWHLLLHYRKGLFGGYESEQDDQRFFMSPQGKTDPAAELSATLTQFFSDELIGRSQQPAQCAFVARYHWLKEQLAFDPSRLPPLVCERFKHWYDDFEVDSISLIFPSSFLNNPASMFGHTLFRVDQKGQTEQTRILSYTVNFAADVPPNSGFLYPIRGIFGSYRGYFSTIPYYLKVQQYRDIENRDIWEYRLNLTETQLQRFLMHAWEMGNAYFDYFYFKENCSYHLLALLDYADPSLHLTDEFLFWTVPADTVRLIVSKPGLVSASTYRPSRSTVIRRKREFLPASERDLAHRMTQDVGELTSPAFVQLNPAKQAFVLDLASDYLRYQIETTKKDPKPELKERNRAVLTARSRLRIPSEEFSVRPFAERPELGHKMLQASLGGGWRNNDTFEEATFRGGYHDLLDPEAGYTPNAQIEMAAVTVRHYNRADQTRVERATLLNLLSLSPMDSVFHSPSWRLGVGMNTIRQNDCQLCNNGVFNAGLGGAKEFHLLSREVVFAFADAEANISKAYHELHRVGGGATVGMLADLTERWKIMATGSYLYFPLGDKSDDFRWHVGSRFTVSRNWAVRLEYNHRDHDNDVLFRVQAFF